MANANEALREEIIGLKEQMEEVNKLTAVNRALHDKVSSLKAKLKEANVLMTSNNKTLEAEDSAHSSFNGEVLGSICAAGERGRE